MSPDNVKPVEILAVDNAVIRPFASTVITGTSEALPCVPALTPVLASVIAIVAVSPAFWNVCDPVASPLKPTVTALERPLASSAVPVKSPTKPEFAVIVVPVMAAAVEPPITVLSNVPPVIVTLFAPWVAIDPRPNADLAPAAVVAPVPPCATARLVFVLIKFASLRSILPAEPTPLLT